jgi:hypothetical protein
MVDRLPKLIPQFDLPEGDCFSVQNGQGGCMNMQLNSTIVQRQQAKLNVEAHAQWSSLILGYTQVWLPPTEIN